MPTEYIVPESVMTDLADTLRANAGWSSNVKLSWPDGYISAKNADLGKDGVNEYGFINRTISEAIVMDEIKIGGFAFTYCTSLTIVSFPACTSMGQYAFAYCTSLTTASFPVCTSIDYCGFSSCTSLTTASFPACKNIGGNAFQNCAKLTTISFPACKNIGGNAFQNCTSLTTASFPVCTSIGGNAFKGCTSLKTASFPVCTSIGQSAFANCTKLVSLYLKGSKICSLANSNAFTSTPIGGYSALAGKYGSIYVKASLLTNYKKATNWTYFSNRFVGV